MKQQAAKEHWEAVYQGKPLETLGWYQPVPTTSLELIGSLNLSFDAPVIDIGGGDSLLSDHLLKEGFKDLTVLDISGKALDRARRRHGSQAGNIHWVESDVLDFTPDRAYTLWHDRATFHFLTEKPKVEKYLEVAGRAIRPGGYLILGTFSDQGPPSCSGLPVQRYSLPELEEATGPRFKKIHGLNLDHRTPSGVVQKYTFCLFERPDGN